MGQKVNPIGMRLQVNRTWDSRWFAESKDYGNLLLEDLRMREFIHKELVKARDQGLAVLLVSADLSEILALSDRILVMHGGRIVGELTPEEATEERLGLLMAGVTA